MDDSLGEGVFVQQSQDRGENLGGEGRFAKEGFWTKKEESEERKRKGKKNTKKKKKSMKKKKNERGKERPSQSPSRKGNS